MKVLERLFNHHRQIEGSARQESWMGLQRPLIRSAQ